MKIVQHPLPADQYLSTKTKKTQIVIHHTSGGSDPVRVVDGWAANPERIATPYIIGGISTSGDTSNDGVVVKAFEPEFDAFHLGAVVGGPANITRATLGIELCSWGYLTPSGDSFLTYKGKKVPADQVCDLGFKWRGYQYWHAYSDAQLASLHDLIWALAKNRFKWTCSAKTWDVASFDFNPTKFAKDQIGTHANYRRDKTDACPQPKLLVMLNQLSQEMAA